MTASGISRWALRSWAAAALTAAPWVAMAGDAFPIAGTYSQNKPCPTDAAVSKRLRVTITPQEIIYASGTCTISDIRRKENAFTLHTSCQMQAGKVLSSDVTFTLREDRNLDMVDQFESYKAVLYRCSAHSSAPSGQASSR